MHSARSWAAIVEMEEVGLEQVYDRALCVLASMMANEEAEAEEVQEDEDDEDEAKVPDISDPDELISAVVEGNPPPWWPRRLDRMEVKIRIQPYGSTPDNIKPQPIDPNTKDLSRATFTALLKSLLELGGDPFEGTVQIQLTRRKDKAILGGWKGEIYVGEKAKKKRGASGSDTEDKNTLLLEYLLEERKRDTESMQRMFANSSNVIHASASAIQALRGANMAPPWMQQEGSEEMPFWMMLAKGAMDVVLQAGLAQQNPSMGQFGAQAMGQMMQQPVHRQPAALTGYAQPPQGYPPQQLPGPTQDNLGYDQYMQARGGGDYEGVNAHDNDLLDDDFESRDPWYDDDEFADSGKPFEDSYESDDDEEYDDDEDYEDEDQEETGNPLAHLSPEELAAHLDDYIDANPNKRAALKNLGMRLAGKLLK